MTESEWTVALETRPGLALDEDAYAKVERALREAPGAMGAVCILDHEKGTLSARFQVHASAMDEAQDIGIRIFDEAFTRAGVHAPGGLEPWEWMSAEPVRPG